MEPPNQDPQYYKLKNFYYNPDDERLLVRSYFTDRVTLNYANNWAWVVVMLIILLFAGIIYTSVNHIR